jgi:excisionase family DNA binding protein
MLTLQEVAETLDVHYMTVYRYVREGMLPSVRVNRSWQISRADLKEFQSNKKSGNKTSSKARHGGRNAADWANRFESRLVDGDERGSLAVLEAALRSGKDIRSIYIDIVMPTVVEIGKKWHRGDLDVFVEHRASRIVIRLISQITPRFARRGVDRGTIIIGAPEGDLHGLGIAIVGDLLRCEGWRVSDLGANLPAKELGLAVKNSNNLVAACVVATMSGALAETAKCIAAMRATGDSGAKYFVAGLAIESQDHAEKLGADYWVSGPQELISSLDLLTQKTSQTTVS